MVKDLPEIKDIRILIQLADQELVRTNELTRVNVKNKSFSIISFEIGSTDLEAPVLGIERGQANRGKSLKLF